MRFDSDHRAVTPNKKGVPRQTKTPPRRATPSHSHHGSERGAEETTRRCHTPERKGEHGTAQQSRCLHRWSSAQQWQVGQVWRVYQVLGGKKNKEALSILPNPHTAKRVTFKILNNIYPSCMKDSIGTATRGFCEKDIETVEHSFFKCEHVQEF